MASLKNAHIFLKNSLNQWQLNLWVIYGSLSLDELKLTIYDMTNIQNKANKSEHSFLQRTLNKQFQEPFKLSIFQPLSMSTGLKHLYFSDTEDSMQALHIQARV